jgi:hypothetical protein
MTKRAMETLYDEDFFEWTARNMPTCYAKAV